MKNNARWEAVKAARKEKENAAYRAKRIHVKYPNDLRFCCDQSLVRIFDQATENGAAYLPKEWEKGTAIQNYNQTAFYGFHYFKLMENTKCLKQGSYIVCKEHGTNKRWILPLNFRSQIRANAEDRRMAGQHIYTIPGILDEIALCQIDEKTWKDNVWEGSTMKKYMGLSNFK